MTDQPESIVQPDQPPPLPRVGSVRPERSRLVPPISEEEEWRTIVESSKNRKNRKGKLQSTSTVDGATFVEQEDQHSDVAALGKLAEELLRRQVVFLYPAPLAALHAPQVRSSAFLAACHLVIFKRHQTNSHPILPVMMPRSQMPLRFTVRIAGSDIATSTTQRSYRCPFCDSTYVAEITSDKTDRRRPEFVIGFKITREQALKTYMQWIQQKSWFRPGDLSLRAISDKQMGVYIPFWHYAYAARSTWRAMIGQYWYRTETYTVRNSEGKTETRTRTVRETEWNPLTGRHQKYYFGFLVSASNGLSQQEALSIQPYDLRELTRFKPYFLAGWLSEEYSVDYANAQAIAEEEFRKREYNNVSRLMPGDTYGQLQVDTQFE